MRIKKLQEGNIIAKQDNTRVSTDTRTAAERNETNPLVGLERTVMPALVTTPATVLGGLLGSETVNNAKNGLATKFIKGDADLGRNALNKNHWIFNREARTPTNVATINRVMPFLSNVEKIPAYKVGRRTKGNNGDRNLLGMYLFKNDPLISPWFQRVAQSFNPADWSGKNVAEGVRATKQAALMDKVGTPYIRREPLMQGSLLTLKKGGSLVSDGRRFKFKDSPLVRNSRALNNKRDMRKKFMKSDRPTYSNNRIRKGQEGLQFVSYIPVESPSIDIPRLELSSPNVFSTYNIPITRDEPIVVQSKVEEPIEQPMKRELFNIKPSKGLDEFNRWYDEVEQEDPEAKNYRQFLTKMAEQESGFNSAIQNKAGAPAYGYFQFMQDGKKYNNISAYAGTDVETFRNNPKLQIKAAIKLAKQFERGFNKQDLELAAQKGYTKFGLLGGAWLAGNGGVRKYLQGLANPSDKHWSKSGSGTDVASRIQMFNF